MQEQTSHKNSLEESFVALPAMHPEERGRGERITAPNEPRGENGEKESDAKGRTRRRIAPGGTSDSNLVLPNRTKRAIHSGLASSGESLPPLQRQKQPQRKAPSRAASSNNLNATGESSSASSTSASPRRKPGAWSDGLTSKKLKDIISVMRDNTRGIKLQEVTYRWKHYPHCFSGKAFVDWVMGNVQGWESREEAIKLGQLMMAKGIFKGINSKATSSPMMLDDAGCYYTFQVDDFIAQLNSKMMVEVVGKMRNEKYGICVKDRKYLLQTYPNCFVGSEAVDWMVEHIFIKTRKEAVELGQVLMNNGFIYPTSGKIPFCDGYQFYCFEDKKMFKRGYLSFKDNGEVANYCKVIRSTEFNNYSKVEEDKEQDTGEDSGEEGAKIKYAPPIGLSKSAPSLPNRSPREKLHANDFKLFWCCIKGDCLWCYLSPRSPQPFTSIPLANGIALKVVHKQCDREAVSLNDKCRFEIITCYEGKQYILIPKTCKKMEKWAAVLYEYSIQGENDLMEEAEHEIGCSMLEKHRLWLDMRSTEKRSQLKSSSGGEGGAVAAEPVAAAAVVSVSTPRQRDETEKRREGSF